MAASSCPLVGAATSSGAASSLSTRAFFGEMVTASPSTIDFLFSPLAAASTSVAKARKFNTCLELRKQNLQSASPFSSDLPLPLTWCSPFSAEPFSVPLASVAGAAAAGAAAEAVAVAAAAVASTASRLSSPLAPSVASTGKKIPAFRYDCSSGGFYEQAGHAKPRFRLAPWSRLGMYPQHEICNET